MESKKVIKTMKNFLKQHGFDKITEGNNYLYAEGEIPILLVAHADTYLRPPKKVTVKENIVVYAEDGGLGADDRAGIIAIMEIIKRGFKPYVLITDEEERGGLGAIEAAKNIPTPPVKYMIEIDRQGFNEVVFYSSESNTEFVKYIETFKWNKKRGIFSDISILMQKWGIAGVNVSAGFYHQHSFTEYLVVPDLEKTIEKICKMLEDSVNIERFACNSYNYTSSYSYFDDFYYDCYEEILVDIDLFNFAKRYGADPEYWRQLLYINKEVIYEKLRESLEEIMLELDTENFGL